MEGVKVLEADREDKINQAQAVRDWTVKSADNLLEYQKFAANKLFQVTVTRVGDLLGGLIAPACLRRACLPACAAASQCLHSHG